jgi:hypothetical protein
MTAINDIRFKKGVPIQDNNDKTPKAQTDATTITNVTAKPMRNAVFSFVETPMNGQMPRKYANTKLLTNEALMNMDAYDSEFTLVPPDTYQLLPGAMLSVFDADFCKYEKA